MPTIVNAVVSYIGEGSSRTLWKLLIGRGKSTHNLPLLVMTLYGSIADRCLVRTVPLGGWTAAKYPNGSQFSTPTISCGTPDVNGTGCLYNLECFHTQSCH